jgi:hypothetical protein
VTRKEAYESHRSRTERGGLQLDTYGIREQQVVLKQVGVYANRKRGVSRAMSNGIGVALLVNVR